MSNKFSCPLCGTSLSSVGRKGARMRCGVCGSVFDTVQLEHLNASVDVVLSDSPVIHNVDHYMPNGQDVSDGQPITYDDSGLIPTETSSSRRLRLPKRKSKTEWLDNHIDMLGYLHQERSRKSNRDRAIAFIGIVVAVVLLSCAAQCSREARHKAWHGEASVENAVCTLVSACLTTSFLPIDLRDVFESEYV